MNVFYSRVYKNLSPEQIFAILDDIFCCITSDDMRISIIATVMIKERLSPKLDVEEWGHKLTFERLERLERYLEQQNKKNASKGRSPEYGIMIMDTEGSKKDRKLRDKLTVILRDGTRYSEFQYLIEDPLFTDSKWRNLSQIVDCIAYCIRRKYRTRSKPSQSTSCWERYYSMIESKLPSKNGSYIGYGLKIYPKKRLGE